jgi:hypothetical protein
MCVYCCVEVGTLLEQMSMISHHCKKKTKMQPIYLKPYATICYLQLILLVSNYLLILIIYVILFFSSFLMDNI